MAFPEGGVGGWRLCSAISRVFLHCGCSLCPTFGSMIHKQILFPPPAVVLVHKIYTAIFKVFTTMKSNDLITSCFNNY